MNREEGRAYFSGKTLRETSEPEKSIYKCDISGRKSREFRAAKLKNIRRKIEDWVYLGTIIVR